MYNLYQINHINFKNIYQEDGQSAPAPYPRNNNGIFFQFLGWLLL